VSDNYQICDRFSDPHANPPVPTRPDPIKNCAYASHETHGELGRDAQKRDAAYGGDCHE
jgi:hypothetical protein